MCNLYRVRASRDEVARTFGVSADVGATMTKDYASPGKAAYVVREVDGVRTLDIAAWGFPHNGKPVTNVRNYASPFWRSALVNAARRCLVPFTSFQEWSVEPHAITGKKKAHWFSLPASPLAAFAGVWRPADEGAFFSFLTCGYDSLGDPAGHVVGAIHPKACPVILHPEDHDRWLTAPLDDALTLATPFPSQLMAVGERDAWHVVEQTPGRVKPVERTAGATINDDPGLERQADLLSEAALRLPPPLMVGDSMGKAPRGG